MVQANRECLVRAVNMSTISDVLVEGISLVCVYSFLGYAQRYTVYVFRPFPPTKANFAGLATLLTVCVILGFTGADSKE